MSELPQELQDLLKDTPLDVGQWGQLPERLITLSSVEGQRESLNQLKALLEQVTESDRQTVLRLREQLNRLRFGGGG